MVMLMLQPLQTRTWRLVGYNITRVNVAKFALHCVYLVLKLKTNLNVQFCTDLSLHCIVETIYTRLLTYPERVVA